MQPTLLKHCLVLSTSFNWAIEVDDDSIGCDYSMILQAMHSFPAIIDQSLVGDRMCDLLKGPIDETNNQVEWTAKVPVDTSKPSQFFTGKTVWIKA